MNRLTDRRTAQQVKENAAGLLEKGLAPAVSDQIYIKLAEYENAEEEGVTLYFCNPELNTGCEKSSCYINGGGCMQTTNIKFRRKLK